MDIPASYVLSYSRRVGVIYKFPAPEHLNGNSVPHYFILIATLENNNYLLISTTQLDSNIKALTIRGIPLDTICLIEPTEENGLTVSSYINCNYYIEVDNEYLENKIKNGVLRVAGEMSVDDFNKIKSSISQSPLFDIPLELINKE